MNRGVPFFFVEGDAARECEDFRAALKNTNMRRIFRSLLSVSRVMGPSLGSSEQATAYNEGLRAVGMWLAARIETAAPGEVAALMRESAEEFLLYTAKQSKEQENGR